jgi:PII-like signaling protein
MGFGATARVHTDKILRLSMDLPVVVECVDTKEKIDAILPVLDEMIGGGLITLEKVQVIAYRPGEKK